MMMDTLARDTGEILSGPNLQRRVIDRIAFTNDGLVDNGRGPSAVMDGKVLKTRLREELFLQAQTRLPITYERLAKRIVVSGAIGAIRNALERLMDDDADEGRPLLAAVAVGALDPGLPAPWFFRKAESLGLFTGDPLNVEAFAFPCDGILQRHPILLSTVAPRARRGKRLAAGFADCRRVRRTRC